MSFFLLPYYWPSFGHILIEKCQKRRTEHSTRLPLSSGGSTSQLSPWKSSLLENQFKVMSCLETPLLRQPQLLLQQLPVLLGGLLSLEDLLSLPTTIHSSSFDAHSTS